MDDEPAASGSAGAAPRPFNVAELPGEAWTLAWRHRWLWVFGLFAGSASGSCGLSSTPGGGGRNGALSGAQSAQLGQAARQVQDALPVFLAIVVGALAVLALIALLFWLFSLVCQGAVIAGGAALAEARPTGMGAAWSVGLRSFWRLLLVGSVPFLLWLVVVGGLVAAFAPRVAAGGFDVFSLVAEAIGWLAIGEIVMNVVGIVIAYAQRSVVLEDTGAGRALAVGWELFRRRIGASLLTWIVGLVLGIVAGIVIAIGLVVGAIPSVIVGIVGVALARASNSNLLAVPFVAVAVVTWVGLLLVAVAWLNTFLWHFWTLAYLRLRATTPNLVEPTPAPTWAGPAEPSV